jgi:hypothetical protein
LTEWRLTRAAGALWNVTARVADDERALSVVGHYGVHPSFRADLSILADRDREKSLDFGLI